MLSPGGGTAASREGMVFITSRAASIKHTVKPLPTISCTLSFFWGSLS